MEMQQFQKMKETREITLLRNDLRNDVESALTDQELGALNVTLVFVFGTMF